MLTNLGTVSAGQPETISCPRRQSGTCGNVSYRSCVCSTGQRRKVDASGKATLKAEARRNDGYYSFIFLFGSLRKRHPVVLCSGSTISFLNKAENSPDGACRLPVNSFFFGIFFLCFKEKSITICSCYLILYLVLIVFSYNLPFRTSVRKYTVFVRLNEIQHGYLPDQCPQGTKKTPKTRRFHTAVSPAFIVYRPSEKGYSSIFSPHGR